MCCRDFPPRSAARRRTVCISTCSREGTFFWVKGKSFLPPTWPFTRAPSQITPYIRSRWRRPRQRASSARQIPVHGESQRRTGGCRGGFTCRQLCLVPVLGSLGRKSHRDSAAGSVGVGRTGATGTARMPCRQPDEKLATKYDRVKTVPDFFEGHNPKCRDLSDPRPDAQASEAPIPYSLQP